MNEHQISCPACGTYIGEDTINCPGCDINLADYCHETAMADELIDQQRTDRHNVVAGYISNGRPRYGDDPECPKSVEQSMDLIRSWLFYLDADPAIAKRKLIILQFMANQYTPGKDTFEAPDFPHELLLDVLAYTATMFVPIDDHNLDEGHLLLLTARVAAAEAAISLWVNTGELPKAHHEE